MFQSALEYILYRPVWVWVIEFYLFAIFFQFPYPSCINTPTKHILASKYKGTCVFYWILSRWTRSFIIALLWLNLFCTHSLQSVQQNFNYNVLKVLSMCYSLVTSLTFLSPCTFCCNQVRIPPNVFVERMCTLIVLYFLLWGRGQRESFFFNLETRD